MLDIYARIRNLKRPNLLARAARFGVDDYRRDIHLRRILKLETLPRNAEALINLLDIETEMDAARVNRSGSYSPSKHVEVLIAIAGETRLMRATSLHLS
ncbi:DUF6477 family protein [Loktanella agnita]|uniref:DUF6477 family protein n=1 Tax=Loktanella agnita TaxID=287097 RepID=UPI003988DF97